MLLWSEIESISSVCYIDFVWTLLWAVKNMIGFGVFNFLRLAKIFSWLLLRYAINFDFVDITIFLIFEERVSLSLDELNSTFFIFNHINHSTIHSFKWAIYEVFFETFFFQMTNDNVVEIIHIHSFFLKFSLISWKK